MKRDTQRLGRPPPQRLHLVSVFELDHLDQRRPVLLHAVHVTTATLEEPHQPVVHLLDVLWDVCRGQRSGVSRLGVMLPRMPVGRLTLRQAVLERLHAADAARRGAAEEAEPPRPHVVLRQQGREQGGQTERQETQVLPARLRQLT